MKYIECPYCGHELNGEWNEQVAVAKEVMEALEKTIVRLNLEETMRRGINEN